MGLVLLLEQEGAAALSCGGYAGVGRQGVETPSGPVETALTTETLLWLMPRRCGIPEMR
ncbi:MAG: hypothetical protein MUC66_06795 [Methanolinea sp.]|nr:hypothetical protein [Methanolinea sp.]